MRWLIGVVAAIMLIPMNGNAQILDGVPPPADFRFTAQYGSNGVPARFEQRACLGCRDRAGFLEEAIEVVGIVNYIPERDDYLNYTIQPGLNYRKMLWLLPSFSVDKDGEFGHSLQATFWKGPFQINSTYARPFEDSRVGQVSIGYQFGKYFMLVPGRQITNGDNWFLNYRVMFTKLIWLQGRYTWDVDRHAVAIFAQWNGLFEN